MQVDHYLVVSLTPAGDEVSEALVVSIDLFDPDGEGELSQAEVALGDFDLDWTLTAEELTYHEQDGQRWYTTAPLMIEGQPRIPRGDVQITVTDLSGREDRREVPLPRTLPELTAEDAARVTTAGVIVPADAMDSLLVVLETADGHREVRELSDPAEAVEVSRIFESQVIHRLQQTSEPFRMWLLHEWSPRMHIESGPWEIDPMDLPISEEP